MHEPQEMPRPWAMWRPRETNWPMKWEKGREKNKEKEAEKLRTKCEQSSTPKKVVIL